jgi:hypothetical protein
MGFRLTSFLGGVAAGYSKQVAEEEQSGKQFGLLAGKNLLEMHQKAKEDNETEIEKRVDIIKTLRSFNPSFTERELRDLAANNGVVDIINKQKGSVNFDPSSIDWRSLIKKSAGATVEPDKDTRTAEERVKQEYMQAFSAGQAGAGAIPAPANIGSRGQRAMEKSIGELATVYGITKEELMASRQYKKAQLAEGGIEVDFGVLSPQDIDKDINKAQVALNRAMQSGDRVQIDTAKNKLFDLNDIKNSGDPKNLLDNASARKAYAKARMIENPSDETSNQYSNAAKKYNIALEASINSIVDKAETYEQKNNALINAIVTLKQKDGKKTDEELTQIDVLSRELRLRQELHKVPKDPKEEEPASVKAGTLITVAKGAFDKSLANYLGSGNYTVDPATGSIIPSGDAKTSAKGVMHAMENVISQYTSRSGENKGKALSEGHALAMRAVGIYVNENGVPSIPAYLGERAAGTPVGASPTGSPLAVKPASSPNLQVPPEVQRSRDADRTQIIKSELEKSQRQLAEAKDPDIRKRLQGDIDALTRELGGKVTPTAQPTTAPAAPAPSGNAMSQQDVMAKKFVLDNANSKDPAMMKDVEAIRNKLRRLYGNNAGV